MNQEQRKFLFQEIDKSLVYMGNNTYINGYSNNAHKTLGIDVSNCLKEVQNLKNGSVIYSRETFNMIWKLPVGTQKST